MYRRHVVSLFCGALAGVSLRGAASLVRFLDPSRGVALLMDVRRNRVLATNSNATAVIQSPPGSTVKPFVLASLLRLNRLNADSPFICPGRLRIGERLFDCVHPRLVMPIHVDTALAYSCNCFVANAAQHFRPGELGRELMARGFTANSTTPEMQRIQALGEHGVVISPLDLAVAYRQLAIQVLTPEMQPILAGLVEAVEFGTAQNARVAGITVAGKTGSTRRRTGDHIAWFAGFMPSRNPEVVITVMLAGRSGGVDAAPVAAEILKAYDTGRL